MYRILLILVASLFALPLAGQEIYKTVDEHGNVIYTDRKPEGPSEVVELPEISVVEPGELGDVAALREPPVRERRERAPELEFRIASPAEEETIWNTAMQLPVRIDLGIELPPGAEIVLFLDGRPQPPIHSTSTTLEGVERGPHTLRAELRTSTGRVLATTEEVTFFMRQQSALHLRPG